MNDRSDRTLDRVGAVAGVAFVLLFVGIITMAPHLPAPQHSIAEIAQAAGDNGKGILFGVYLGALLTGAQLVFGAVVASRLWRAEGPRGGWWLVAVTGVAGTAVGLVTDTVVATFVRAVGHGVSGDVLWIGYPSGPDGVIVAIPLAVFLLGVGFGARASAALPRWLAWSALVLSAMLVVGAGGVTGDEIDGGVLGDLLVLGYLGMFLWTLAVSVFLWRRPAVACAEAVPSLA